MRFAMPATSCHPAHWPGNIKQYGIRQIAKAVARSIMESCAAKRLQHPDSEGLTSKTFGKANGEAGMYPQLAARSLTLANKYCASIRKKAKKLVQILTFYNL